MDTHAARLKLDELTRKRDELTSKRQRILGRYEEAQRSLRDLDAELRTMNLDPEKLDDTLSLLEAELQRETELCAARIEAAARALEPFDKI